MLLEFELRHGAQNCARRPVPVRLRGRRATKSVKVGRWVKRGQRDKSWVLSHIAEFLRHLLPAPSQLPVMLGNCLPCRSPERAGVLVQLNAFLINVFIQNCFYFEIISNLEKSCMTKNCWLLPCTPISASPGDPWPGNEKPEQTEPDPPFRAKLSQLTTDHERETNVCCLSH